MTIEELKNMDVKVRGYAMPDDNAPDFYKRCKVSEALDIMKEVTSTFPKEFYNLTFIITKAENDDFLFKVRRELDNVYLGDNNFNLTKELVKEALGME